MVRLEHRSSNLPIEADLGGFQYTSQAVQITSLWRAYLVRRQFLSPNIYAQSKLYLKNHPDLTFLPRAPTGSAPVYFPFELPVVFKECGLRKSIDRFMQMYAISKFCKKNGYKNIVVPRARPYEKYIIEEKILIPGFKQKELIGLYSENREKFTLAVREFTALLCQVTYGDLLTSTHPYQNQKDLDIPLGRYDNIPFFLENGEGKIGLIDLEEVQIRKEPLSEAEVFEVARTAILLFPYHFSDILSVLNNLYPEVCLQPYLDAYLINVQTNFNIVYQDHREFIRKKKITLENHREFSLFEKQIFQPDPRDLKFQVLKRILDLANASFKESMENIGPVDSYIKLVSARSLTFHAKEILYPEVQDSTISYIVTEVLLELKEEGQINYGNLYRNRSGELLIRIDC